MDLFPYSRSGSRAPLPRAPRPAPDASGPSVAIPSAGPVPAGPLTRTSRPAPAPRREPASRAAAFGLGMLVLLPAAAARAAEDWTPWAHYKDIYYDTSPDGAGVAGTVFGFPVLVRLTAADFPFAEARDSGQDLRFSKPDGTPVPFEIDAYDKANKEASVWVLADTLLGNHKGPLLRMYWGNAAAAAASEPAKVFSAANGFAAAWHLRGRYPTARPNAVAGGMELVPSNYDSDEEARGLIGFADSLDGRSPGDHLQTWQAFDSLSRGFTFSVWARPAAAGANEKLMDFGNGPGQDNLSLGRADSGAGLRFESFRGASRSVLEAPGALVTGEWQHLAVTVSGKTARIYRNGSLAASGELADSIAAVRRGYNYLGRSNWAAHGFFGGLLDEPEVSYSARAPEWIKLAYINQRPERGLVSFEIPITCASRFAMPADTAVSEASPLKLSAKADCAAEFAWSVDGGPSFRILDPETRDLDLSMPRVTGDTVLVLGFTARYRDSTRTGTVRIAILNSIPEPEFSLPEGLAWNGADSLRIRPVISNAAAVAASSHPDLRLSWTAQGLPVDTAWDAGDLVLLAAEETGELTVGLCMDNGGPPACESVTVRVEGVVPLRIPAAARNARPGEAGYGVDGRLRRGPESGVRRFRPPK